MSLAEQFENMEPRERMLLSVLGAVFGAIIILLIPIMLLRTVWEARDKNQEIRDIIATIDEQRDKIAEQRSDYDAMLAKYKNKAPPVAGIIETAAKANGISVSSSSNRPDVPHGDRYTERLTVVELSRVGLLGIANTLEKIARSPHPIAITKLSIKPHGRDPDTFNVELGVSAFDRKELKKKEKTEGEEEEEGEEG